MSKEINIEKLSDYKWWQVKRHRSKGEQVYTCSIQEPTDPKIYYSATDEDCQKAILSAVVKAAKKEADVKKD